MTKKILIIGGSGQLGKRLIIKLNEQNIPFLATGHTRTHDQKGALRPLDLNQKEQIDTLFDEFRPTLVFLVASLTNVDYCEDHPTEARRINVDSTQQIAMICRQREIKLIFVSSEYVFDGRGGPYTEYDKPHPISVYGQTKLEGEQAVLEDPNNIVARTTVVYDWDLDSKNYVMNTIKRFQNSEPIKAINDQWSHPTLARDLAAGLWELSASNAKGIFHVVGADYRNRYQFTQEIARTFGFDANLIKPVKTKETRQKAPRPLQAGLINKKAQDRLSFRLKGTMEGLTIVKQEWEKSAAAGKSN